MRGMYATVWRENATLTTGEALHELQGVGGREDGQRGREGVRLHRRACDDRDASHGGAEARGRVDQMVMPARGIIIDFVTAGRRNSLAGKRKLARIGRPRG